MDLVAGRGVVVAEYFDVGCFRRLHWAQRPKAAALLDALADPGRGFDAIVVGEYERAFAGDQLIRLLPMLDRYGVQVWLPEAGGPINVDDPAHRALVLLLGHQSRREILRSRFRTTAAMRAQARDQGRHLGGRPPYGYRLVDAGPHPSAAHAAWGRRRHRLDVDPVTAPHVRWIFAQRLAGHSTAGIARTLNALGVPSPAAYDRARNRHRSGEGWTLRGVAAILANPRYTGRQVWLPLSTWADQRQPGHTRPAEGGVLARGRAPDPSGTSSGERRAGTCGSPCHRGPPPEPPAADRLRAQRRNHQKRRHGTTAEGAHNEPSLAADIASVGVNVSEHRSHRGWQTTRSRGWPASGAGQSVSVRWPGVPVVGRR